MDSVTICYVKVLFKGKNKNALHACQCDDYYMYCLSPICLLSHPFKTVRPIKHGFPLQKLITRVAFVQVGLCDPVL